MAGRQFAIDAAQVEVDDTPLYSYTCRFPGCGKVYSSSDGARKHARNHHPEWLKKVEVLASWLASPPASRPNCSEPSFITHCQHD